MAAPTPSVTQETDVAEQPGASVVVTGRGMAVLLLHGWGSEGKLWGPVAAALADHFTVITPDFPGFGNTPPPPTGWSVDEYARWTVALLDRLGIDQVHVVSHSFGGRVAVRLATTVPHRVNRMVLCDSSGIRPRRGMGYHLRVRSYKALRRLARHTAAPGAIRRRAERWMAKRGSADYRAATGTVRESLLRIVNEDFREELPGVAAPTLLVWGEMDAETPLRDGRRMERGIPDAGMVVFEGRGHYAYAEDPKRFVRIVDVFLTGVCS